MGQRLSKIYDSLDGLTVGILGLTYKPGTSTLRRAISLEIILDLVQQGVSVRAYDPLARLDEVADLPPFEVTPDPYVVATGADALVLVTEWDTIRISTSSGCGRRCGARSRSIPATCSTLPRCARPASCTRASGGPGPYWYEVRGQD